MCSLMNIMCWYFGATYFHGVVNHSIMQFSFHGDGALPGELTVPLSFKPQNLVRRPVRDLPPQSLEECFARLVVSVFPRILRKPMLLAISLQEV